MSKTLTGVKDIDLKIISYLNDYQVAHFSQVNKYIYSLCENYWRDKTIDVLTKNCVPLTISQVNIWKGTSTWKKYYLFLIKCGYSKTKK